MSTEPMLSGLQPNDDIDEPQASNGEIDIQAQEDDESQDQDFDPQSSEVIKEAPKRKRRNFPFPTIPFEEALNLAIDIQRVGSGKAVRRLTLFDELGKSPDSGTTRQLITDANKYGLIKGNYSAEYLELTPDGHSASSDDAPAREKARARVKLALQSIAPFNALYNEYVGNKLPSKSVLIDALKNQDVSDDLLNRGVDNFIINCKFVGILVTLAGAERLITIDHLLDSIPATAQEPIGQKKVLTTTVGNATPDDNQNHFDNICFYVTPIGIENSPQRAHADLFLSSLIEPALEEIGLQVVRADQIDKPGLITTQVIEYLLKSRLVIADLSFHNPNVFYELAIRHSTYRATVQIIRSIDSIPFDLNQVRTIIIDDTSIYTFVPKLELYRAEIANQVRRALEDPVNADNPLSSFYPQIKS